LSADAESRTNGVPSDVADKVIRLIEEWEKTSNGDSVKDTAAIDATAVATTIRHLISTGTSELVLLAAVARCHLNVSRAEFGVDLHAGTEAAEKAGGAATLG
jgi:hypothetical protein